MHSVQREQLLGVESGQRLVFQWKSSQSEFSKASGRWWMEASIDFKLLSWPGAQIRPPIAQGQSQNEIHPSFAENPWVGGGENKSSLLIHSSVPQSLPLI